MLPVGISRPAGDRRRAIGATAEHRVAVAGTSGHGQSRRPAASGHPRSPRRRRGAALSPVRGPRRVDSQRAGSPGVSRLLTADAREILEFVLDNYVEHGPIELRAKVLTLPPLRDPGSPSEPAVRFGGGENLHEILDRLGSTSTTSLNYKPTLVSRVLHTRN